jgi:hypothetical protein
MREKEGRQAFGPSAFLGAKLTKAASLTGRVANIYLNVYRFPESGIKPIRFASFI